MVHRWRCRRCDFTVWSASKQATETEVESHLLDHHRSKVSREEFQVRWECPYCEKSGQAHDESEGVETFKRHLFGHVEPLIEADVHVADDINGTGSILVLGPASGTGTDNARVHFLSPADIAIFVTTTPAERIRLLEEDLQEWPAWTIVVTTKDDPLSGLDHIDFANVPLEIVKLDKALGLDELGETVSRVVSEQESTQGKISLEFDILSEITEKFQLQDIFKFLHLLTSRLENANALSHYYFDPRAGSESTINVLDQAFDMTITATDKTFTSQDRSGDS